MTGLAGALSVGAFGAMIKSAAEAQDQIGKLSQSVGVSVRSLSEFKYAAELSGVSVDGLGTGLKQLAKSMAEAHKGSGESADAFAALGVSVTDSNGKLKRTDDLMLEVADTFAGMDDGATKTALAMRLFGRSGADLIPMLNQGRAGLEAAKEEAVRLGVAFDDRAARAAQDFQDNLTRLNATMDGFKMAAANSVIPGLNAIIERMREASKITGGTWSGVFLGSTISGKQAADPLAAMAEIQDRLESLRRQREALQQDTWTNLLGNYLVPGGTDADRATVGRQIRLAEQQMRLLTDLYAKQLDAAGPDPFAFEDKGARTRAVEQALASAEAERKAAAERSRAEREWIRQQARNEQMAADEEAKATAAWEREQQKRLEAESDAHLRRMVMEDEREQREERAAERATERAKEDFKRMLEAWQSEEMLLEAQYEEKLEKLRIYRERVGMTEEEYDALAEVAAAEHQARLTEIYERELMKRTGATRIHRQMDLDSARTFFGGMSQLMNTKSRELFEIGKAAAIGETIINTYKAATGAYAALASIPYVGPALGAAAAAAAIAAGMANVQAIRNQSFGAGSGAVPTFAANPTTGLPAGTPGGDVGGGVGVTTIILRGMRPGDMFTERQVRELLEKVGDSVSAGGRVVIQ